MAVRRGGNEFDGFVYAIVMPLPAEAETCIVRAALGTGDAMSLCVHNCFGEARRFTNWRKAPEKLPS